jgi:hypothetical protein
MRLRRIEPPKSATSSTTAAPTASTAAQVHSIATSRPTRPSKSATPSQTTQQPRHRTRNIANRATLPLRLRNRILDPLANIILAVPRKTIRLPHRAIHCHRIARRRRLTSTEP